MHLRDAVDAVRADEGEVAHAHPPAAAFVDQRDRGDIAGVPRRARFRRREVLDVDPVDDLEMARQHSFEQLDRPRFQRFGQQRVVGVGNRLPG